MNNAAPPPPRRVWHVYVLYALSGFVSLGYQVAWFRIYVDRFGSSTLTFAIVLCNFIVGLAAGAIVSRRLSAFLAARLGVHDRLRQYGLVELCVAVTALLTLASALLPADTWGHFPYLADEGIYRPTTVYQLSKLLIAVISVFIPCFFMGATFPMLCRTFADDGRFPAALYAWNTFGACAGVLVCQFLLMAKLGHDQMYRLMIALNAGLGLYFLWRGGRALRVPHRGVLAAVCGSATTSAHSSEDAAVWHPANGAQPALGLLLALAVASGFMTGALEGDMFKRIGFLSHSMSVIMPFVSFWAILAIFTGSAIVRAWGGMRLVHIKIAAAVGVAYYAFAWRFTYPLLHFLGGDAAGTAGALTAAQREQFEASQIFYVTSLTDALLYVGFVGFPAFALLSLILPWVCNRLQASHRHLGLAYGLNTLAFCGGVIGFTLIAPRVNIFYALKLLPVVLIIGVVFIWLLRQDRAPGRVRPLAALIAAAAAVVLVPRGFDRSYVSSQDLPADAPVRAVMSNGAVTSYVVSFPDRDAFFFDNHNMSDTSFGAQSYMRLMAHMPLLAQADPRSALLICYGVGNTASAIASHACIEQIDIVDLNDKVFATAPEFVKTNGGVYADPRVRLVHDDGRAFLNLTDERYDLITSEPPPPMQDGVYRLYSREYYQAALEHLTDRGMMTQWLPVFQLPPAAVDLMAATFLDVFDHVMLFTGFDEQLILIGGRHPIDFALIEAQFESRRGVAVDLRRSSVHTPVDLLARFIKTDEQLRWLYADHRPISDQHNDMAVLFRIPYDTVDLEYEPRAIADFAQRYELACRDELIAVIRHPGRLRHHVPGFPASLLDSIPTEQLIDRGFADVDWTELDRLQRQAAAQHQAGNMAQAARLIMQALDRFGEQPALLLRLAQIYAQGQRLAESVRLLEQVLTLEPQDVTAGLMLGFTYEQMGQPERAVALFSAIAALRPNEAEPFFHLGRVLAGTEQLDDAARALERSIELAPDNGAARSLLAHVYVQLERPADAITQYRRILQVDPANVEVRELLRRLEEE